MMGSPRAFFKAHKRLVVFFLLCFLFYFASLLLLPKGVKQDQKQPYVYTGDAISMENGALKSYLPVINLKGRDAKKLNAELKKIYLDQENTLLTYTYDLNGEYLSFAYCIIHLTESLPTYEMKTAVFYLPSKKRVENEELLELFDVTEEDVLNKMDEKMQFYYFDAIEKRYIEPKECDYTCFLKERKLDESAALQLYIRDDILCSYRAFNVYSVYNEEEYFTQDSFRFEIAVFD